MLIFLGLKCVNMKNILKIELYMHWVYLCGGMLLDVINTAWM